MFTSTTALTRERWRRCAHIVRISAALGAIYGTVFGLASAVTGWHALLTSMLIGVISGTLIGSSSAVDIFILRQGRLPWFDALPLALVIALRTLIYGGVAAAVAAGQPGERLLGVAAAFNARSALITIGFSLAVTAVLIIVFQAAVLVGYRTFLALLLGKYRQPHAEQRYFLFVDVVGSTAIAERLGPYQAHRFLASVFSTVAEPIALCRGEIYQYVGDEIVVTWSQADGTVDARPVRCVFEMRAALLARSTQFLARFGVVPHLRAALHEGEVIAGEVGEMRRAIVFHGDVMNTTGRLEQATREIDCHFIASANAIDALGSPRGWQAHDLGELRLRGRVEPIRAFCVSRHDEAPEPSPPRQGGGG